VCVWLGFWWCVFPSQFFLLHLASVLFLCDFQFRLLSLAPSLPSAVRTRLRRSTGGRDAAVFCSAPLGRRRRAGGDENGLVRFVPPPVSSLLQGARISSGPCVEFRQQSSTSDSLDGCILGRWRVSHVCPMRISFSPLQIWMLNYILGLFRFTLLLHAARLHHPRYLDY
jgi:hypothetical protein